MKVTSARTSRVRAPTPYTHTHTKKQKKTKNKNHLVKGVQKLVVVGGAHDVAHDDVRELLGLAALGVALGALLRRVVLFVCCVGPVSSESFVEDETGGRRPPPPPRAHTNTQNNTNQHQTTHTFSVTSRGLESGRIE